ncbi:hypothetical protein [Lacisediminihabitans profunda]|uniref:Uncharacterized protein n=1 Tax=Lacisediminihabitans profunda TaxID=2594790 RepID=A0A5C8UQB9_9MICO|nr:hypothetical protein [Lacisediminihabitans profunda]TXN30424.1 hypothetical protein FVP33_10550 [Lacisediminihabitans profunda]
MTSSWGDKSKVARRAIISGLAAAAVIVGVTLVASSLNSAPATPSAQTTPSARATAPTDSTAAPAPTADPGAAPTAAPAPGPSPTAPRTSTEVQKGTTAGAALPPAAPLPVLFSGPMPRSASAVGKLVAEFPAVIPVAPGSTITDSSVSSSGNFLQATLSAKTSLSPQAVIAFYQSEFTKVSLPEAPLPAVGGSTAFDFARDGNSITLTVSPSGSGGSTYTVLGVLRASSS